ncbi:Jacalin-like lectin domain [Phytophthora infestans]|uniref:Jacalin-like lectin domain n=1 Tax=Phytophthora infestans TaxID=4787 RepID=A0A833SU67_PHYIN|nr:Jacalin-like lectin domain [Phytophthora infestans]
MVQLDDSGNDCVRGLRFHCFGQWGSSWETFGGLHGHKYSDLVIASPGQNVRSITIRAADRVDAVILNVEDRSGQTTMLHHGGKGGAAKTLELAEDEHIIGIQAHWGKYYRHTRIMYIEFTTDAGNTISGGSPTSKIGKDSAPHGYHLGGFAGYSGNELDSVGAIWTSIAPVE